MIASVRQSPLIHLRQPLVILGAAFYFINDYTDTRFNVPAAEFCLLGLIFLQMLLHPALLKRQSGIAAMLLSVGMIALIAISDKYHGNGMGHLIRVTLRNVLFYGVILGYMLLPQKKLVLQWITGFMLGYIINFFMQAPLTIATNPGGMWELKYILPTPAVILFMLMHRGKLSRNLQWLLLGYLLFILATMPFIGSRGAFLSLFVGMGFYALARIKFMHRTAIILLALYLPFLPLTIIGYFYEEDNPYIITDWLDSINYATHSNVERSLMTFMNIKAIKEHPWAGIGVGNDIKMMAPYFISLTDQIKTAADSPHNYYMEIAVPYGLPALALALAIWFLLYRTVFTTALANRMPRGIAAFCCGVVAWIMLYQPVAGITRMDVFAIMLFGLYSIRQTPATATAAPHEASAA